MGKLLKRKLVIVDLEEVDARVHRSKIRGAVYCRGPVQIKKTLRQVPARTFWVSMKQSATDDVLRSAPVCHRRGATIDGLVTIEPPRPNSVPGLASCFRRLAGTAPNSKLLPVDELLDVLSAPSGEAAGLFIAGVADRESQTLALTRGNLKTITVPFSMFKPSGTEVRPDFARLRLTDYGHTVRLGEYEASSDAILYEADPEYRRKAKKKLLAEEQTFGASLRRLRIQKGLSRGDFGSLSSKTIARIERNDVKKPRGETLRTIAARLGVEPDQIESY